MINVATIGVSGFGDTIYKDIMNLIDEGKVAFAAATIINQDEEAEKCAKLKSLGCRIFSDYKEMLAEMSDQIDLCYIPTGIHLHRPMTIDCLKAGVNVVVEKPIAATVQDVREMQEAEAASGKFVAVGYQHAYLDSTLKIKKMLVSGDLGDISIIKAYALWPRTSKYYNRNNWAGELRVGDHWVLDSPFTNANAHQLNLMGFWAGKTFDKAAKVLSVQAELYRANKISSADTASIRVKTENGPDILFVLSHALVEHEGPVVEIIGSKGKVHWTFEETKIETDAGTETFPTDQSRQYLQNRVVARVNDPSVFVCGPQVAGTHTLCSNGAFDSSEINPIPDELIKVGPHQDGSELTSVDGLEDIIRQCFKESKLISETGVTWGKPGKVIDLTNYTHFPSSEQ